MHRAVPRRAHDARAVVDAAPRRRLQHPVVTTGTSYGVSTRAPCAGRRCLRWCVRDDDRVVVRCAGGGVHHQAVGVDEAVLVLDAVQQSAVGDAGGHRGPAAPAELGLQAHHNPTNIVLKCLNIQYQPCVKLSFYCV